MMGINLNKFALQTMVVPSGAGCSREPHRYPAVKTASVALAGSVAGTGDDSLRDRIVAGKNRLITFCRSGRRSLLLALSTVFWQVRLFLARVLLASLILTGLVLAGSGSDAMAQSVDPAAGQAGGQTGGQGKGTVKSTFGAWSLVCETPPGASSEQCALMQNVVAEDRQEVGLSVVVLRTADKKTEILRVLAPLGVLLPNGLGLNVDTKDIGRAYFVRCFQDGCYAEVELSQTLIDTLKNGKTATFIVFQTPEEGIGIPVDLKGFGDGYKALP